MSRLPMRSGDETLVRRVRINHSVSPDDSQILDGESSNSNATPEPSLSSAFANPTSIAIPSQSPMTYNTPFTTSSALSQLNLSHSFLPTMSARDLWSNALQKLPNRQQETLREIQHSATAQQPLSKTLEELISITRRKQEECEKKSHKFRFRGREIILRDIAGKIIIWLNKFKEIGDIAVNFDPVHASLPWAGVRFLLQVAVGEHEQMGALLTLVEKLTYVINRCTIYERLYNPENTPKEVLHNLQEALVEMYVTILRSIALVHGLFDKNTAVRAFHALVNPGQITDLLASYQAVEERVEIEAQNCERISDREIDTKLQELLASLTKPILRTDETVSSLLKRVEDSEGFKILEWISNIPYGKYHDSVKVQRTNGTCEWLLKHARFQEWQNESSSTILWLHGTAGTGKTYLTSKVIDEIQASLRSRPNHEGLAFFYCNRNEVQRQEPLSIFRSYVRQLSTTIQNTHSIQTQIQQFYLQTTSRASEPTMPDCKKLLLQLVDIYPRTTLILDALDECERSKRSEIIGIFHECLAQASKPVKIFISSRPDYDIKRKFQDLANVEIQATDNYDDISKFIKSEITKHEKWEGMKKALQRKIVDTLQEQSQGMFQWARLQIDQLFRLTLIRDIKSRLGKLPKDLKVAYDEIFDAMTEGEIEIVDRAFRWVMCACTPLKTKALLPAVCQDGEGEGLQPVDNLQESDLLHCCRNLLVIDNKRNVWIPAHLSVIEYVENHRWNQYQANCLVASVCLSLLIDPLYGNREQDSETEDDAMDESLDDNSNSESAENESSDGSSEDQDEPLDQDFDDLREYARFHWMVHVRNCENGKSDQLSALLKQFLGSPNRSSSEYKSWYEHLDKRADKWGWPSTSLLKTKYRLHRHFVPHTSAHAICAFGLYNILLDWWETPWEPVTPSTDPATSLLQAAAVGNNISICNHLITWGTDLNEEVQHSEFGSALVAAVICSDLAIVELFIEKGAEVDMQVQGDGNLGSALAAAAWNGAEEKIKLFIENGAQVDMQVQDNGNYGSALAAAAATGAEEKIKLLIEYGANVNMQLENGFIGSALAAAAWDDHKGAVELLIQSGADVNMQLQYGSLGSALATAVFGDRIEQVKLLIESGAEVNMQLQYGYYGSALAAAASWNSTELVKLLIGSGAKVNMQLQYGTFGSALVAAIYWNSTELVKLLIGSSAEVNMQLQYGYYGSALVAAVFEDRIEQVKLLIKYGAEVNMQLQYGYYGSALVAAVFEDRIEQVKLLIKYSAEVNIQLQHGDYGSALVAAALWGGMEMVELLLKFGAEVNMQFPEKRYRNALAAAKMALFDRSMKVKLLMEHGAIELEETPCDGSDSGCSED